MSKNLKNKFKKNITILVITFVALISMVALFINFKIRSVITSNIYISKTDAIAAKINQDILATTNKAYMIQNFVINRILENDNIDVKTLTTFLNTLSNNDRLLKSIGIYLSDYKYLKDTISYNEYIEDNFFSIETTNEIIGLSKNIPFNDLNNPIKEKAYQSVLNSGDKTFVQAYINPMIDNDILSSLILPIKIKKKTIGLVKIDFNLSNLENTFYKLLNNLNNLEIINNQGLIVYSIQDYYSGKKLKDIEKDYEKHLLKIYTNKKYSTYEGNNISVAVPLTILNEFEDWQLIISWNSPEILTMIKIKFSIFVSIILLSFLILLFIFYLSFDKEIKPFNAIVKLGKKLSLGEIENFESDKLYNFEFNDLQKHFEQIAHNQNKYSEIIKEIGNGNFNVDIKLSNEHDVLGKSIVEMKQKLIKTNTEEQNLKREAQQRAWASEGIAKFNSKLKNIDIEKAETFNQFLPELIDYIEAVQATIFRIYKPSERKENWELRLISTYAYNQNKYLEKIVKYGEGLIGMCAKEKNSIFLKEVPDNYLFIKSGFGATNPKNIFISPLIFNDEIFGVLEIASLHDLEQYKIDFLEELSSVIAAALSGIQTAEVTNRLLDQTKKQALELQSREEELRQNLEELQATQDKYQHNLAKMDSYKRVLRESEILVEFDRNGKMIDCNDNFLEYINEEKKNAFKINLDLLLNGDSKKSNLLFSTINKGNIFTYNNYILVGQEKKYFQSYFTPVLDANKKLRRIIAVAIDTTELESLRNPLD